MKESWNAWDLRKAAMSKLPLKNENIFPDSRLITLSQWLISTEPTEDEEKVGPDSRNQKTRL